ncbi:MAG: phosphoglucosamine mutase [Desulfatibacillaceae bacterium]|nr:phosphoglucosamine mutase [Desulfatibacillaceae bacterium]
MEKLFGTDGVRGRANSWPITPEMCLKIGQAAALYFKGENSRPRIIIGKDTRISSYMVEAAVAAGISSTGADALLAGVLPTPGIALAVREIGADAGIVISASHNPYHDNGIKIFDRNGYKLTDEQERKIEEIVFGPPAALEDDPGSVLRLETVQGRYADFLAASLPAGMTLGGLSVVLDCANGAAYAVAPRVFARMGAFVRPLFFTPNGKNINLGCGSQNPEKLCEEVVNQKAHLGLAFDGDADRCIAVDETGSVVSGDRIVALCAAYLKEQGRLKNNTVVTTVMSNLGLKECLARLDIRHILTEVGDRYVFDAMRKEDACLGGEDSGHVIFLDRHSTGDGILTGLQIIAAMNYFGKPLSALAAAMSVYPQRLINVPVNKKPNLEGVPAVCQAIEKARQDLGEHGRILVRYSGTRPVCRVMVEGPTLQLTQDCAERVAAVVREELG